MKYKKKAAIFDPYLDTIGGGEVYSASVTKCLLESGFLVDIFWKEKDITEKINKYLGIDITKARINTYGYKLYSKKGNFFQKIRFSKNYDLVFFLSDGSIPILFSKKNILHFQIPFTDINGDSLVNRLKLRNIHHIICNSNFTKEVIDREFIVSSEVIYPPVNIKTTSIKKYNIILSVGRFTKTLHRKRQDILVSAFKQLVDQGLKDWKLKLIGSSKEGKEIVSKLMGQAKGYPIEIIVDVEHGRLEKEYASAAIFWHAAGYGIDEKKNPQLVEHFGIATAEAMSAGCVPIVINKGGQPEIVKTGENGYLWDSTDSLKKITLQLIRSPDKMKKLSKEAEKASNKFSKERFCSDLSTLITE